MPSPGTVDTKEASLTSELYEEGEPVASTSGTVCPLREEDPRVHAADSPSEEVGGNEEPGACATQGAAEIPPISPGADILPEQLVRIATAVGPNSRTCFFAGFESLMHNLDAFRSLAGVEHNVFTLLLRLLPEVRESS